jgi:hypothetical protein
MAFVFVHVDQALPHRDAGAEQQYGRRWGGAAQVVRTTVLNFADSGLSRFGNIIS